MEMKNCSSSWVVCLGVVVVLAAAKHTTSAGVSCGDAVSALIPCGSFLLGEGGATPSAECCQSAQSLNKMTTTAASRRAVCECFKQTGPSFGVKPERARRLPPFCKLRLNIPINPNVNCSSI